MLVIRDETWLVTRVERATDGWFIDVQGLSELVRDTEATFSTALDHIQPLDPALAEVVADDSAGYRKSRLWLEATLRKTAVPLTDARSSRSPRRAWPTRCPTSSTPCARLSTPRTSAPASCSRTPSGSARRSRSG